MTALPSPFSVDGKAVFVTGAASGLGRAIATEFAEHGAHVALFDQNETDLAALGDALAQTGVSVVTCAGDVRDANALDRAIAETKARFGRLDVAVANAGVSDRSSARLHDADPEDWQRVVDINLAGVYITCRPARAAMMENGSVKVITVASMWGIVAPAGLQPRPAYAATKGAVVNLTRELALEYAPDNIQVNALCSGFFRTATRPRTEEQAREFARYTPMGRIADSDEIKGAALFLASSASDFMTGQTLVIDGGVTAA